MPDNTHFIKLSRLLVLFLLFNLQFTAQKGDTILGIQPVSDGVFSWLDIPTNTITDVSGLTNPPLFLQGQSTYDRIHQRYFVKGAGIFVIDAKTGYYLDTITNYGSLTNFEYDERTNALVGPNLVLPVDFISIDLNTKTTSTIAPLVANGFLWGESTFDRVNRRYFYESNQGITVVDSTGTVEDHIPAYFIGIEYDPDLNTIFGSYDNGTDNIFASVDVTSHVITDLFTLEGYTLYGGESTYDELNHRYFIKSAQGILMFDALSGILLTALDEQNALVCIEYAKYVQEINTVGIRKNQPLSNIQIYPNPSEGKFCFSNLEPGANIEVSDISGRILSNTKVTDKSTIIDLTEKEKGVYVYKIFSSKTGITVGKLVLE